MSSRSPKFSIRFILAITTIVAIAIPVSTYVANQHKARRIRLAQLAKQDADTLKQIVIAVEEVRKRLGRVPVSQLELEAALGRKLPSIHDNGYPTPINYWRTNYDSYNLQYELWTTEDWIFDSRTPGAGWVQHFHFGT